MKTALLSADVPGDVARAASLLRAGQAVAFPTETVYGLGADATRAEAVRGIFAAKERPADNPLIVHLADAGEVERVAAAVPAVARRLMAAFWPGPLTLVLPRGPAVPDEVTCGLDTVGVRVPDHPAARALLAAAGVPVAAPSANRSGRPSPTRAAHVVDDLGGRIAAVLDGGPTGVGLESTVLDVTLDPPMLLRPGGVTREQIEAVIGPIAESSGQAERPRSPGQKYAHYAPAVPLVLVSGGRDAVVAEINRSLAAERKIGNRPAVLCALEDAAAFPAAEAVVTYGRRAAPAEIAARLYDALRAFDRLPADTVFAAGLPETGLGAAIMNRLRRAAGDREVRV